MNQRHHQPSIFAYKAICLGLLLVAMAFACLVQPALGKEPYQRFVSRLRDEGYTELALTYLDDLQSRADIDADFKSTLNLERALLHFHAASKLSIKAPQRAEKLSQTESLLRKFVEESSQHPRRGEARLKLGGLLRLRAEEALSAAGSGPEQGVPEAVKYFDAAHQHYEESIRELAEIESGLKGARVDPQDTAKVAYRNQVRMDLREAQLYSAKAVEDRGRSRGTNDKQYQSDLEQSLKMYADLYRKETTLTGIRTFALLYRSGIHKLLGQDEDAIDGYQRILDMENVDELRPVQTEALTSLIQILATQQKFMPAVERADAWIAKLKPAEKDSPEALGLRLAYSQIRNDWLKQLKSEQNNPLATKVEKALRSDLRLLSRVPGSHVEQTKLLLAGLGIEEASSSAEADLPKVKNLTEALDESQKRMEEADSNALALTLLDEQIRDPALSSEDKDRLTAERDAQLAPIQVLRQASLELLRTGLRLYDGNKDDRSQLFNARFRMAYLLLKLQETRDAIVIAEFLSRTSPGTVQGLNAASVVLQGFSELLQRPGVQQTQVMSELAPFAQYLVATWPKSSEAIAASGALTQLAVLSKDWDQAETYLQIIPTDSPGVGRHYFDLGAVLYDQYQALARDPASTSDPASLNTLRDRATKWLQLAVERVDSEEAQIALGAATALAQLKMDQDDIDGAAALMLAGDKAVLNWLDKKLDKVSTLSALQAYRTAIRITAAQVVSGSVDAKTAATSMHQHVDQMQRIGAQSSDGQQRLQAMFTGIATDLKEKLSKIQQPEKRAELSEVVLLLVGQAAQSDSYATQIWAATTLVGFADGLSPANPESAQSKGDHSASGHPVAQQAYTQAATLLQSILDRNVREPGWIPEGSINVVRIQRARACQGMRDFRNALTAYAEILDQNDGLIDVQMEVARVLQQTASNNAELYKSAINGARPSPKTKRNVFWGWGRISQETSRRIADFGPQFYESRYQLARCRLLYALSLSDTVARQKELSGAERVIFETHALYPELGNVMEFKRYDALLKKIQKELGKPESGLKSLES